MNSMLAHTKTIHNVAAEKPGRSEHRGDDAAHAGTTARADGCSLGLQGALEHGERGKTTRSNHTTRLCAGTTRPRRSMVWGV